MRVFVWRFLIIGLLFGAHSARSEDYGTEAEFQIKKSNHSARIENYYTRLHELELKELERQKGEDEMRQARKKYAEEYEKSRSQFVKEKKEAPKVDPTAWEREVKAREVAYEKTRQEYTKKRDEMNKLSKGLRVIPEEEEYDLDPNYDGSAGFE